MSTEPAGLSQIVNGTRHRQKRQKRRVHFEASINWTEESEKSSRGSETRRERREQIQLYKRQKMNEQKKNEGIFLLLKSQDVRIVNRLAALHGRDDTVRAILNLLIGHGQPAQQGRQAQAQQGQGGQGQGQPNFEQSLAAFRNTNRRLTYQQLTVGQQQQIQMLGISSLTAEFRTELPSEVITDGSSEDETKTTKSEKKRSKKLRVKKKQQRQKIENFKKSANRRNGGPPPAGQGGPAAIV